MLKLDHLAIAGVTLPDAERLVTIGFGPAVGHGVHPHFGTHNALWGLGLELYVEAIAIDPDAVPAQSPRWFGLDQFSGPARPATWILATDDMAATLAQLGPAFGTPVRLTRGAYTWDISVPADGMNGFDGMAPAIIQWHGPHPAVDLHDCGARLRKLCVSHPDASVLAAVLTPHLNDDRISIESGPVGMSAEFDGPNGVISLK